MEWAQFFYIIGAAFIGFMLYRYVRANPGSLFSSVNIYKSLQTLGLLALLLMAFVGMCIVLLR